MTESGWSSLGILPGREGMIWSLAYEKKFALLAEGTQGGHLYSRKSVLLCKRNEGVGGERRVGRG